VRLVGDAGRKAMMLQTAINVATLALMLATLATTLYGLWRMIAITAEAREARAVAVAAAHRSEEASIRAASHARDATDAIAAVAQNVNTIKTATDGMQSRLENAARAEGHLAGVAESAVVPESLAPAAATAAALVLETAAVAAKGMAAGVDKK